MIGPLLPPARAPRLPIWAAPMAGGPSSTALIAVVGRAGGLGIVPAGYLSAAAFAERLDALPDDVLFGTNLFLPATASADADAIAAHAHALAPHAARHDVALGTPRWEDDELEGKLAVLAGRRPSVVTFTFGAPDPGLLARVRDATGATVLVTVTTPEEAEQVQGADGLVVQGAEAGGHRGVFTDDPALPGGGELIGLHELLARVRAVTPLPLVATGGLMTGAQVRAALDAGAAAVALGTAFLATPEAGTSEVHRRALLDRRFPGTTLTRAFTGRPARGLANALATGFPDAPAAYPEIHHVTRPLRAAAAAAGDAEAVHLWAGEGWRAVTEEPAGALVRRLAREAGLAAG